MVVSKLVTFTPTKTQAVHLYCDSLSLPYKISPFLPPESVWTDYADTIIKFSPIDRFPISIAVEAKLNLVKSTDLTCSWLRSNIQITFRVLSLYEFKKLINNS